MPESGSRALTVEGAAALPVLKALASGTRLAILSLLGQHAMNVSELALALGLPHSTVNFNLGQLQAAGLLSVEYEPGTRGAQKRCSKRYDEVYFKLPGVALQAGGDPVTISMPVGNHARIDARPTCGLASEQGLIGRLDDPRSFSEPEHVYAQLLWFGDAGSVAYAFPNNLPYGAVATQLELSLEVCSEAPPSDPQWPSDITVWVNGQEVGTFTSPGDFSPGDSGGERGRLTPGWRADDRSMDGLLKRVSVRAPSWTASGSRT